MVSQHFGQRRHQRRSRRKAALGNSPLLHRFAGLQSDQNKTTSKAKAKKRKRKKRKKEKRKSIPENK
jgi:hypothetical protein